MRTCVLCHFETVLDDVALRTHADGCICLRCYARETATTVLMPKALRKTLTDVLAAAAVA